MLWVLVIPPVLMIVGGWRHGSKLSNAWGMAVLWIGLICTVLQWPLMLWWATIEPSLFLGALAYTMINISLLTLVVLWRHGQESDDDGDDRGDDPNDPPDPSGSDDGWDWDALERKFWQEAQRKRLARH